MIQILGLRKFTPKDSKEEKTYDAFHDKYWRTKTVASMFANIDKVIERIPEKDRWNIFYTVANCTENKREFDSLGTLAFDIDGINTDHLEDYIEVILSCLGLERSATGIVSSGHGLHFLITLQKPVTCKDKLKELKPHYKAICTKINKAMLNAGLGGSADSSIFEGRRLLRLPNTMNRKPGKPEVMCRMVQPTIKMVDFDIIKVSGMPAVKQNEQLNMKVLKKFPHVESVAVMAGCEFLKECVQNPDTVDEHQWYAALSITGRLNDETTKDGYEWSHELSKGYKGYDPDETDQKLEQALEASGPRTCENIATISDACKTCEYRGKVSSPILIRGVDSIATQHTGFHNQPYKGKGKPTPNYDDLVKFFEKARPTKGLGASRMVHVWDGKKYVYMEKLFLEEFAQIHFNPSANTTMVQEFSNRVTRTNVEPLPWWEQGTAKKINFQNGYLDIKTMDFRPHDPSVGFRYILPYEYDSAAEAPVFSKMLEQVTGGNPSVQDTLLEFMGYALSNDTCWAQKAIVLVGDGANGKSTLINALRSLAGDGNTTSLSMDHINKSEYNRQMLDGKLFNISEEMPTKAMADTSLFKTIVTGGAIHVRSPYKDPYFIKTNAKMIFACNELPDSGDNTLGFFRRLLIIPFKQTFTKDVEGFDPHIEDKISDELAGIFNLAMKGYKRLVKNQKFTESKEIEDAITDYKMDNDSVFNWFTENMVVHLNGTYDDHFTTLKDLYTSYKFETESQGRRAVTMQKFAKTLRKLVPTYEERNKVVRIGEKTARGLQGVSYQQYS